MINEVKWKQNSYGLLILLVLNGEAQVFMFFDACGCIQENNRRKQPHKDLHQLITTKTARNQTKKNEITWETENEYRTSKLDCTSSVNES